MTVCSQPHSSAMHRDPRTAAIRPRPSRRPGGWRVLSALVVIGVLGGCRMALPDAGETAADTTAAPPARAGYAATAMAAAGKTGTAATVEPHDDASTDTQDVTRR